MRLDGGDLVRRPRDQDHPVGLQALPLAGAKQAQRLPVRVDPHPPEPVAGDAALPVAELDQPALAGEHLDRQLARVLAGHRPLDPLDDGRDRRAVVGELLGAVVHGDAGALADVLVVGALVGVLEPPPAADVVDQHHLEVGAPALDVGDQPLQLVAALQPQPALALVGIGANDQQAVPLGVLADLFRLVLGRVLLMVGRHPHVLGGADRRLVVRVLCRFAGMRRHAA